MTDAARLLTREERAALERIANAATPGMWTAGEMTHYGQPGTGFWYVGPMGGESDAHLTEEDAAHIAACNPDTVLRLLAQLDAAEHALREIADLSMAAAVDGAEPLSGYRVRQIAQSALDTQ